VDEDSPRNVREGKKPMKLTLSLIVIACVVVGCFLVGGALADAGPSDAGVATAADGGSVVADAETPSPGEAASGLIDAFRAGKWLVGAGFALLLIGTFLRKVVGIFAKEWASSRVGGKVLGGGAAFLVAMGVGLATGVGLNVDLVFGAVALAGAAAGLWSMAPSGAKAKLK
jgi:hypothetical protein